MKMVMTFEEQVQRAMRDNPDLPEEFIRDALAAKGEDTSAYVFDDNKSISPSQLDEPVDRSNNNANVTEAVVGSEVKDMEYGFKISVKLPDGADHEQYMEALERYCSDSLCGIGIQGQIGFMFEREAADREAAIQSAIDDIKRAIPGCTILSFEDVS